MAACIETLLPHTTTESQSLLWENPVLRVHVANSRALCGRNCSLYGTPRFDVDDVVNVDLRC